MNTKHLTILLIATLAWPAASHAQSRAKVGDITRMQGHGVNEVMGFGLVTGLAGTGDGGKYLKTMRDLREVLGKFDAHELTLDDVSGAKNVAIVHVSVTIQEHGCREGDRLDVAVTALNAKSLKGGRLLATPLVYQDPNVKEFFGYAYGSIELSPEVETAGVIRDGARMERDVFMNVITTGAELRACGIDRKWIQNQQRYITLVLDDAHAGWAMAAAIAQALDKELGVVAEDSRVALALDTRNVLVLIPDKLEDPAAWIRDIDTTDIMVENNEARVTINRRKGTIVVTGDTRISPVVVSQMGLTVTVSDPMVAGGGSAGDTFVPVDVAANRSPGVKDLLEALNQLKVEFKDRVAILEEIHHAGNLHARILYED